LYFVPGIAWFLMLLLLICLPGKSIPDSTWINIVDIDKLVHAALFGGLVGLFCWPFSKADMPRQLKLNYFLRITLAACVWGITTEFIQKYFIPGRQFDMADWLADSAGALIAYFICRRLFARKASN
jgi:VanZ family protein